MTLFDGERDPATGATEAHARASDPEPSHTAAMSIDALPERQRAVARVLGEVAPVTHEQLIDEYRRFEANPYVVGRLPAQTDQSIRSRCAELVDDGVVVAHDREGRTKNNRPSTRWALYRGDV